ncbi:hypothetical protein V8O11_22265 [Erwinia aphidicola]|uniref:hypothetical protein n=1 Tax=Erwinia aphidicola TaxID=68334 RepID=UPI00300C20A9
MATIIMSAFRQSASQEDNLKRHHRLDAMFCALGLVPKLVLGSYVEEETGKPGLELALRVGYEGSGMTFGKLLDIALKLAQYNDQDSILVLDRSNGASLVFPDGRDDVKLGTFTAVSQHEALKSPYWSNIGGTYYVCKE